MIVKRIRVSPDISEINEFDQVRLVPDVAGLRIYNRAMADHNGQDRNKFSQSDAGVNFIPKLNIRIKRMAFSAGWLPGNNAIFLVEGYAYFWDTKKMRDARAS